MFAGLMFNTGIGQHILKNPPLLTALSIRWVRRGEERVTGLLILILGISKHRKDS